MWKTHFAWKREGEEEEEREEEERGVEERGKQGGWATKQRMERGDGQSLELKVVNELG